MTEDQMEWQPIETAPKDGTVILVATWEISADMASAKWNGLYWDTRHMDDDPSHILLDEMSFREFGSPTHWMTPPPPPDDDA